MLLQLYPYFIKELQIRQDPDINNCPQIEIYGHP